MGIYLNPNNEGFREAINSEIYVDKTGLIAYTNKCLNTEQKFICVSRPRRFGKSMALNMLAAYYSCGCDSKELLIKYNIGKNDGFEKHLNQYNVIYLNIQQFLSGAGKTGMLDYLEKRVKKELLKEFGEFITEQDISLADMIGEIYLETDRKFIFLIDEWDCVMREVQEAEDLQKQYLDFLRNLLKDRTYVALAYMTGILPIKKYGSHSALNMFSEFSMTDPSILEEYVGFTENEVKGLCERFHMNFVEISRWYDGYSFMKFLHVYSPKSVVDAMLRQRIANYWTKTETYDALKVYIDMDYDGLREAVIALVGGTHIPVHTRSFQNDMKTFDTKDDVLTLLIHLGYLAYDIENEEVYIPNKEILEEYETALSVGGWKEVMEIFKASDKLLKDTLCENAEEVAAALDKAHTEVSSVLTYNDENSLSCAIALAYYSARKRYNMVRELPTGKGFADIVFLPIRNTEKTAIIVELKVDKKAASAIAQIKEKNYTQALEGYRGEILLVGISYNRTTKKHECKIERYEKS